jgi:peroxiredoxin
MSDATKQATLRFLRQIPGVGKSIAEDLFQSKILKAIFGRSVAEIVIRLIFMGAVVGTLAIITVGLLSPGTSPAAPSSISQSSQGHPVGLQIGDRAPNFTLTAPDGKKVSLNTYRGKPVMLNFWYASCPGCLAEIPGMQRFYASQHTAGRDFAILGVNSVDDVPTARQFIQQHGLTYQIVMDSDQSVAGLYHVTATPTSYFIDRQGIIRSMVVGPVDDTTLQQDVTQISA